MAALLEYDNIQDAVQASMRTASRAADDLNGPREIQRIVAELDKAREQSINLTRLWSRYLYWWVIDADKLLNKSLEFAINRFRRQ
jgi:hypothetical protein